MTVLEDLPVSYHDVSSNPSLASGTSLSAPSLVNDFDRPIAIRKGVRSCVRYPLTNFVSYQSLSPSYRRFTIGLSFIFVPCSIVDALSQP